MKIKNKKHSIVEQVFYTISKTVKHHGKKIKKSFIHKRKESDSYLYQNSKLVPIPLVPMYLCVFCIFPILPPHLKQYQVVYYYERVEGT